MPIAQNKLVTYVSVGVLSTAVDEMWAEGRKKCEGDCCWRLCITALVACCNSKHS